MFNQLSSRPLLEIFWEKSAATISAEPSQNTSYNTTLEMKGDWRLQTSSKASKSHAQVKGWQAGLPSQEQLAFYSMFNPKTDRMVFPANSSSGQMLIGQPLKPKPRMMRWPCKTHLSLTPLRPLMPSPNGETGLGHKMASQQLCKAHILETDYSQLSFYL